MMPGTTSSTPAHPTLDGSIPVLPGFLDFHAKHNPDRPWVLFSSPSNTDVTSVSFSDFASATHRIAHALRPNRTGAENAVVGVLVQCDVILYITLLVGMTRAGLVPLPISPRNSPAAIAHLLKQTSAHRLISQSSLSTRVDATKAVLEEDAYALSVDELPDLYDIYPSLAKEAPSISSVPEPYPPPTRPRSRTDVVLYLHSSGSTGFPKAIPHTDTTILDWCKSPILDGARRHGVVWAAMPLPTFHTMGMYAQVYAPLSSGYPIGLYAPQAPLSPVVPTPQNVLEAAALLGCTGIAVVPAFIEAWAQSDEDIVGLASLKLKILVTGGGPLSSRNGDRLVAAGIKLCSTYGGTEFGTLTNAYDMCDDVYLDASARSAAEWCWLSFPKNVERRWLPEGDGTYELQILTSETYHPSIENLPDAKGYATQDLFEPHPTKPGLWRVAGRKDDVLVLRSGEKIVPLAQEGHVTSSAMVDGAVMFGRGKSQCGILIEPRLRCAVDPRDERSVAAFRNKIWPVVEEANGLAPTFGRIFKEMILVTDPGKPLPRAPKNTIIRRQALALYDEEIEALYRTVAEAEVQDTQPPDTWAIPDVESWLIQVSSSINRNVPVSPTIDVFDQGFDSLHATFLRNRIIATLRGSPETAVRDASTKVSHNVVFEHPTLHDLAGAITALVGSDARVAADVAAQIQELVDRYSRDLPKFVSPHGECPETATVVLLTGSTGNVGSHILATLLANPHIFAVYTFNRPAAMSSVERHAAAFRERSLSESLLSQPKLTHLVGDLSAESFGLPPATYGKLVQTVTHVVHNAWKVDFNHALKSFEPLIAGTRRLVDACYTFSRPVRLLYTSSVSAAAGHDPSLGAVPEEPLPDPKVAVATGYGASKFVVERTLTEAAKGGLSATSLRVGQVCGGKTTGAWSTSEWVAVLVKSSVSIGALPALSGTVSWIPMDTVAAAVTDILLTSETLPALVNVVHPRRSSWCDVLQNINKHLPQGPLPFVSLAEWIGKLDKRSGTATAEDLAQMPAIKLLDFFSALAAASAVRSASDTVEAGGMPVFSTTKLEALSDTVRNLAPLDEDYAKAWVEFWTRQHFL